MSWEIACADMCRACMKVDGVLLPMYDDDTISRKNLPDKLAELASIQIDRFDGLPNMLCAKCAYRTDAFYDFKLQVQATERKLRKMFETQVHSIVKEEEASNEYEHGSGERKDESLELRLLDNKPNSRSMNDTESLENTLTEVIKINEDCEQRLEIDVSQLEQCDVGKNNVHLRNILISKVAEIDVGYHKTGGIKNDIPDEISKMLQAEHLDYTIMYIPETDIDSIEDVSPGNALVSVPDNSVKMANNKKLFASATEILNESENTEEFLNGIYVPESTDSKVIKAVEDETWETVFPNKEISKEENVEQSVQRTSNLRTKEEEDESDGSDSDYFIDPKDNILGSLNDTITRIKEVKLEGDIIQYQCTLCLQNYDKLTGVLLHTIDNHVPSTGPFFCVVCEKDCESHRELRAHVKTHTDFPRHRCPKCGLRFKVKSELESHITTHIHGAPYACSQCPRMFNHKGNYKRHLITHLDPQGLHLLKYPCKVCGKRFLNNHTLETHMRVHTGEKPFKCEFCGRSFSQQGNLLNHVRIHSNPRSYTCEVCGKRFNQRATLRDHSLLHTGEKPYVCNVCGIAFTFSAALRRHMWTHTGGKPFGCEICNARFVGKYDLRRHMRVHTDRPRAKRKRSVIKTNDVDEESKEEVIAAIEEPSTETVFIEQVLLTQDVTHDVRRQESEKENVDALFNLIQYDS
ncbi:hypothetical protein KM043_012219 [Ampulex compressa]|nr:hypothetical protein KM043_012219 [Ampulex compressa]